MKHTLLLSFCMIFFLIMDAQTSKDHEILLGSWKVHYKDFADFSYEIKEDDHHRIAGYITHMSILPQYRREIKKGVKKKLVLYNVNFNGTSGVCKHRVNFKGQDYATECKLFMPDKNTLELTYFLWGETVKEVWTRAE